MQKVRKQGQQTFKKSVKLSICKTLLVSTCDFAVNVLMSEDLHCMAKSKWTPELLCINLQYLFEVLAATETQVNVFG